jgi:5-methylcytosine-specific restriction endonuclease McrA
MPDVRQCRECLAKVPSGEFAAHKAAHRAEPARTTRMMKPCHRCNPAQLISAAEWVSHLQWHANHDPSRPRSRSGTYKWQQLRAKVIKRDGGRCTGCGRRDSLQVHHIGGGALWKHADLKDAELVPMSQPQTLCSDCHSRLS